MTRVEFLTQLDHKLSALSKEEADQYLDYYAEMLADRMEDGMSEEEAVASLESVDTIAARILGAVYTTPKKKTDGRRTAIIAVCIVSAVALIAIVPISLLGSLFGINRVGSEMVNSSTNVVIEEVPVVDYVGDSTFLIDPQDITALDVTWISGYVNFEVWDEPEIGICEYDGNIANYESIGGTLYVKHDSGVLENGSGELTIFLPRDIAEYMLEKISVHVTSADATINGINARRVEIFNISGFIQMEGQYGEVIVETTSGDVSIFGSVENVELTAVSGSVYLYCDEALRSLEVDSTSGDVTVSIPEDLGFTLTFDSVSGSAVSGYFDASGDDFRYTHGNGEAQLRVDTVSGWMFLE